VAGAPSPWSLVTRTCLPRTGVRLSQGLFHYLELLDHELGEGVASRPPLWATGPPRLRPSSRATTVELGRSSQADPIRWRACDAAPLWPRLSAIHYSSSLGRAVGVLKTMRNATLPQTGASLASMCNKCAYRCPSVNTSDGAIGNGLLPAGQLPALMYRRRSQRA